MTPSQPGLRSFLERLNNFGNGACVGYDLCMKACPVVAADVPISELNAAADDPSAMTDRVRQFVIDCVMCGRCTEACPTGAPRDHMMLHLRANMPERPEQYAIGEVAQNLLHPCVARLAADARDLPATRPDVDDEEREVAAQPKGRENLRP